MKTTDKLEQLSDALAAVSAALVDVPDDVRIAVLRLALGSLGATPPAPAQTVAVAYDRGPSARVRSYPDTPPPPPRKPGRPRDDDPPAPPPAEAAAPSATRPERSGRRPNPAAAVRRVSRGIAEAAAAWVAKRGKPTSARDLAMKEGISVSAASARVAAALAHGLLEHAGAGLYVATAAATAAATAGAA